MTGLPAVAVALMSGSGGLGKTVAALTIAGTWAQSGPVRLIDADDTKEAGTATDWLDRARPAPPENLTWSTADRRRLLAAFDGLPRPIVVDTAPNAQDGVAAAIEDLLS